MSTSRIFVQLVYCTFSHMAFERIRDMHFSTSRSGDVSVVYPNLTLVYTHMWLCNLGGRVSCQCQLIIYNFYVQWKRHPSTLCVRRERINYNHICIRRIVTQTIAASVAPTLRTAPHQINHIFFERKCWTWLYIICM